MHFSCYLSIEIKLDILATFSEAEKLVPLFSCHRYIVLSSKLEFVVTTKINASTLLIKCCKSK